MNRTVGDKNAKTPKPVKKIEIDESKIKLRTVLFIVAIIVAVAAFGFGLYSLLNRSAGWTKIEVEGGGVNASLDLSFYYDVGKDGNDANTEYRAITALYGDLCVRYYQLFDEYAQIEGLRNLNYINRHPNEIVEIDEELYSAIKFFTETGGRAIYSFPAFEYTEQIFIEGEETLRGEFDYVISENAEEYISELYGFFRSDGSVSFEFYDDNKIKLYVSPEYLQFLAERQITNVVGWGRYKNAFLVDRISDELSKRGFIYGIISSYDGYTRVLGETDEKYDLTIYDAQKEGVSAVGSMEYSAAFSIVYFRDFPLVGKDYNRIRVYSDGRRAHDYIDDCGFYKSSVPLFLAFSEGKSCAEIAIRATNAYVSDKISESALYGLQIEGIGYAYMDGKYLHFSGNGMNIDLSEGYEIVK
ncbi:MAG: hypothetical protein IJ800_04770 [Clostridia bacterium]|nr:hypothetical protein [Clostridia bacterium]